MKIFISSIVIFIALIVATNLVAQEDSNVNQAENILANAIKAHGGKKFKKAHYQFTFRDKVYQFKNNKAKYAYTMRKTVKEVNVVDVMENDEFIRTINDVNTPLGKKEQQGAMNGLNSVIYFATLPYKLLDPAVNLAYAGSANIKGQAYDILQVSFDEEGGGVDHDDQFLYWIRKDNHRIEYLAYSYQVNGGGVRFRAAYNTRMVDGILFQDYINYKAPLGMPLAKLPAMYEKEELKKLSVIATESVLKL